MTQTQPRLLLAGGRLYLSYFTVSRQGQIVEHLSRATSGDGFTTVTLSDRPYQAGGFIGDYQALAVSGTIGYALWNDTRSGQLEIVAERFAA